MIEKKVYFLYGLRQDLFNKQVWLVANNDNMGSVVFLMRKMLVDYMYHAHVCTFDDNLVNSSVEGEMIKKFEAVNEDDSHFVIEGKSWYLSYENIKEKTSESNIFLFMEGWYEEEEECIVCGRKGQLKKYAEFYPFVTERMFKGEKHKTGLSYCPRCGMTYSTYRPKDDEASQYYWNYRDSEYQKRRQYYEPAYTAEFNAALADPPDGGMLRRKAISDFLDDSVDFDHVETILDYGGDRGQFIPDVFPNATKYVYDISGVETEKGVTGIRSAEELMNCGVSWDLILCNQCMEHLSDIKEYFERLVACMSANTYLYIEVPNERSILNSYTVKIHEHINMFSQMAFHILAEQSGLTVVKSTDGSGVRCLLKK